MMIALLSIYLIECQNKEEKCIDFLMEKQSIGKMVANEAQFSITLFYASPLV